MGSDKSNTDAAALLLLTGAERGGGADAGDVMTSNDGGLTSVSSESLGTTAAAAGDGRNSDGIVR